MDYKAPLSVYEASRKGDVIRIRKFIQNSRAINEPDAQNAMTLLHYACYGGSPNVVEILCSSPHLLLNCQDNTGSTPLHAAVDMGHENIATMLMSRGSDGSIKDIYGKTPLHYAAANGNFVLVRELSAQFPEIVALRNNAGMTAFDLAYLNGHNKVLMYLSSLMQ